MNLIFFLLFNSCYFLNLNPGVMVQGLGGCVTTVNEGLYAFENPGLIQGRNFNITLSRYLYGTGICALGWSGSGNAIGIGYHNYGRVWGYDESGNLTGNFTPYNMILIMARRIGRIGFSVKGFEQRIREYTYRGLCLGMGFHLQWRNLGLGVKIDNWGREFYYNREIPLLVALGIKVGMGSDLDLFLESKSYGPEFNIGLLYRYQLLNILLGARYLRPKNIAGINAADFHFSGGFFINIKDYRVGYSFLYTCFSTAHQISVVFNY